MRARNRFVKVRLSAAEYAKALEGDVPPASFAHCFRVLQLQR